MASTNKQTKNKQKPQQQVKKDIPATKMTDKKQKKQKKSSEGSSKSSCCPWFFGSLVLLGAIVGIISYETNVIHNGKFEETTVGRVLKQAGALPYAETAWFTSLKYSARGYKWTEENAPIAYSKSKTFLEPYCEFTKDLGITILNSGKKGYETARDYVYEKVPVVLNFIDSYAPGMGDKISDVTTTTFKGLCSITCSTWRNFVDFFKTKVFVGNFSPENIGKVVNTTSQRALGYYSWFHEKVDLYAKLE